MYTLALTCIIAFHPPTARPPPTQYRRRGRKTHPFITISPSLRSRFLTTPARFDLYFCTKESFCFTGLSSSPSCWYKNRICATETFCPSRTRHLLIRMRVSVTPSAAFTMMRLALPPLVPLLPPPPASSASFRGLDAIWLLCDLSSSLVFCILYLQFCIYTDFLRLFKSVACYVFNLCELRQIAQIVIRSEDGQLFFKFRNRYIAILHLSNFDCDSFARFVLGLFIKSIICGK